MEGCVGVGARTWMERGRCVYVCMCIWMEVCVCVCVHVLEGGQQHGAVAVARVGGGGEGVDLLEG